MTDSPGHSTSAPYWQQQPSYIPPYVGDVPPVNPQPYGYSSTFTTTTVDYSARNDIERLTKRITILENANRPVWKLLKFKLIKLLGD